MPSTPLRYHAWKVQPGNPVAQCERCQMTVDTDKVSKSKTQALVYEKSCPGTLAKTSTVSTKGPMDSTPAPAASLPLSAPKWSCGCGVGGAAGCKNENHKSNKFDEPGKKFDAGKPSMSLLPGEAMEAIARVLDYGAKKYDAHNWRKGMSWSRLLDGGLRHLFAFARGERKDPETGLSHLAHAGAGLLFLITYEATGNGKDDLFQ